MATNTAGDVGREYPFQTVHYMRCNFTYADNGKILTMGTLPPKAIVIDGGVVISTVFNWGTNNRVNIGTTDDDDDFATQLSLLTKCRVLFDEMATTSDNIYNSTAKDVIVTPDLTGTTGTTGAAYAYCLYVVNNDKFASSAA